VHFYRLADRQEVARISPGDDADNVRVNDKNGQLLVGYGSGGLAIIEPSTHTLLRELSLPAHPEGFAIVGSRVFVNVPGAHAIIVGDLDTDRIIQTIGTGPRFANYPMASDSSESRIAVAFRFPASLSIIDPRSGHTEFSVSICKDVDDLYFEGGRIIAVCGEGAVEIINSAKPHDVVRIVTARGARTGLFDAAHKRLFIAAPAAGREPAALWELSFAAAGGSNTR
jgi:hypothetical protein